MLAHSHLCTLPLKIIRYTGDPTLVTVSTLLHV